jgi:hypothetical protein
LSIEQSIIKVSKDSNDQPIVIAGAKVMRIAAMIDSFIGYFSEATARIFSLDRNTYPATGVQPFEGEITKKHH